MHPMTRHSRRQFLQAGAAALLSAGLWPGALHAADVEGKTVKAFNVDSFPDYYLIDRSGKLRIADCKNGNAEDAIKALLAEEAPEKTASR